MSSSKIADEDAHYRVWCILLTQSLAGHDFGPLCVELELQPNLGLTVHGKAIRWDGGRRVSVARWAATE